MKKFFNSLYSTLLAAAAIMFAACQNGPDAPVITIIHTNDTHPALCIPDNWNQRYPRVEDIPEVSEIWGVKLGKKFMMDIRPMNVYGTIGNYKGRVLIVHGTNDQVVPLDYSKRAVETYNNASLKIIEKAGHGFNPAERPLSNQYVKEFLSNKYPPELPHPFGYDVIK